MPSSADERAGAGTANGRRAPVTVAGAFLEGWRRVLKAPVVTAGVFAVTVLVALPSAMAIERAVAAHLGQSLAADRVLSKWEPGWAAEFAAQAQGAGRTLTHEILGFGGTMAIVSGFLDRTQLDPAIVTVIVIYVALWVFLSGGLIDRFARARRVRANAFFSACAVYFLRFLRLAPIIGGAYWVLLTKVHPWLFDTVYTRVIRDMTVERDIALVRGGLYVVFLMALMAVSMVADFTKVRAVVEDRRSMLGALAASLRFIRRRPLRVVALYLLNVAALLVVIRLWRGWAPSSAEPTWTALLGTQIYFVGRLWAKLAFLASEVVFFQGQLAHADYTATPELVWPDSPGVESIGKLRT